MISITVVLAVVTLIVLAVGIIVWLRNPSHMTYQSFLGLCVSGALWIVTNLIFGNLEGVMQYADALVSYGSVGLFATFFIIFSMSLTNRVNRANLYLTAGLILSTISSLPNIIAIGVEEDTIQTTPFLWLYGLWLVTYFLVGLGYLITGRSSVSMVRRQQINAVLRGIVLTFIGAAICNLLLPILGEYKYVTLGPVFSLIFILTFAYTIIKHQMFDIRRTLGLVVVYGLSVGVLGAGLGFASYALFVAGSDGPPSAGSFITVGIAIAALFPVTKRIFDYVTRNLLFRSDYDIQLAIDEMTAIFSSSNSVEHLEKKSCQTLAATIKATKVEIVYELPSLAVRYALHNKHKVIVRDNIEDTSEASDIIDVLRKKNIAMYKPLIVNRKTIGYLCVSEKANGTSYSHDDIEFIDIVSNELAIALQNAQQFRKIQHFNDDLQNKVKEATSELRLSNKKLREIDASKDEFISMASHQLRTPLTSIKGYLSMILDGDLGEIKPEQRRALEEAFDSSQRMVYLIGDFLNLSRIQTGRFELERRSVSLPTLLAEEIDQLRQSAKTRNITLLYDEPTSFPTVEIDETKIRQVMMNFIDNAIYYAKPNGGEILILLEAHRDAVTFSVKDNGIGVPSQAKKRLFSKFYRADNAKKARPDGTGIGLYMAKRVVVAHGGSIVFESTEGEGSVFGFRLPLSR